jgi:kinesin family protein 3/17
MEEAPEGKRARVGKLNLVDLAGSERVRVTGATG